MANILRSSIVDKNKKILYGGRGVCCYGAISVNNMVTMACCESELLPMTVPLYVGTSSFFAGVCGRSVDMNEPLLSSLWGHDIGTKSTPK